MSDGSAIPGFDFIPVATPVLKTLVAQYAKTLEPERYTAFLAELRQTFARYQAVLAKARPGVERARAVHELVEAAMSPLPAQPSCHRGCSACCHLEVEVTKDEGELLAQVVRNGKVIDHGRLATQASRERKSPEWRRMAIIENRCVFLADDGACGIYPDRPATCRKHVVVSPATECAKPGGHPQPITIPVAELVLSAALSAPDNPYSSLSKALSAALAAQPT